MERKKLMCFGFCIQSVEDVRVLARVKASNRVSRQLLRCTLIAPWR